MLKENQFINSAKEKGAMSPKEEWMFRSSFRKMTTAEKKRHDSDYVKEKNKLNFSLWFELIGDNIDEGNNCFERNKDNVSVSKKHNKKRRELNDPEYREYLGLGPLNIGDVEKAEQRFKKNTEFSYPLKSVLHGAKESVDSTTEN